MDFIKLDRQTTAPEYMEQMVRLEQVCGLEPFSKEMLTECIEEMDTYAFIDNGIIHGFISIHSSAKYLGGGLYIVNLNVAPENRRQGIGEKLMRTALVQYGSLSDALITLDVTKTNTAALKLYQKLGFRITDLPSANGDSDYVMICHLSQFLGSISTKNLHIRPIALQDAPQLGEILRNDIVKQTYMVPDLTPDAATKLGEKISLLSCDPTRYIRGIYLKDILIGQVNDVAKENGSVELGWFIHPQYHSQGYATEAVSAMIPDLFNHGFETVTAGAFAENAASLRVMQKCGMELQEFTEDIEYRGVTHKCIYYAIGRNI